MSARLSDNWWDTPEREGGRWVLRLRITIPGLAAIDVCLTVPEAKEVLESLRWPPHHSDGNDCNSAWWAYECCQFPEEGDGYYLAGEVVNDVPVILYRDDHFNVTLPHEIGEKMMTVIERRLAEIERIPCAVAHTAK
jgi:hypothetical protein